MAFKKAVVLTGGIATGKSTVLEILSGFGILSIDADRIAHEILDAEHLKIAQLFGHQLIKEGRVDRKALGAIIFGDAQKKAQLEALLHPLIYTEIASRSAQLDQGKQRYLIDIPLFFETRRYPIEESIVVYAPKALQLTRLMARNNFSQAEAQRRIDAQMDIELKRAMATYVIDNRGDFQSLQAECAKIRDLIL